ncbi:RTA1 like protein [Basidiobolus meristosporus CBS 931.73]|uniref:RTA1 like protein n=1 Tax=Basidiobolus meristosporus CBS 931.73 TaxID=1314790 RepID=A0A1Y1WA27_9FUNG|nr:RTA1 like protein [Basidiobolus meristosporus CBS 931.73]|eukprot:ORX70381.1 RTA1 like protein [Basidiobolus meristosporus CBS 931.73]
MPSTHYNLYHYDPNIPLAVVALILFSLFAVIVSYQAFRYKTGYMYAVACGAAGKASSEAVGYATRIWSAQPENTGNIGAYATSTLFLLLPPIVIALGSYIVVARIITASNFKSKYIRPSLVEKSYVSVDVICFLIQSGGGGMMAIRSMANLGSNISLAGLSLAFVSLSTFVILTWFVQHSPRFATDDTHSPARWRTIYWPVWINIVTLVIRSAYRLAEFAQGFEGYLITHEVYFYVFDCLMMLIAISAYILIPPGRYLTFGLTEPNTSYSVMELEKK